MMYHSSSVIEVKNVACKTIDTIIRTECYRHSEYNINLIDCSKDTITCSVVGDKPNRNGIVAFNCSNGLRAEYWIVDNGVSGEVRTKEVPSYHARYHQLSRCVQSVLEDVYKRLG